MHLQQAVHRGYRVWISLNWQGFRRSGPIRSSNTSPKWDGRSDVSTYCSNAESSTSLSRVQGARAGRAAVRTPKQAKPRRPTRSTSLHDHDRLRPGSPLSSRQNTLRPASFSSINTPGAAALPDVRLPSSFINTRLSCHYSVGLGQVLHALTFVAASASHNIPVALLYLDQR